jgi:hypothetical protein
MKGRVVTFDESTLVGVVQVLDPTAFETIRFHSTSFRSATSFRWPRVGEEVEVVFNQRGQLLSIEAS